jgi:anti-sigma factor RsiW
MNSSNNACNSLRELYSAYLDGAVSGETMHELAAHLETCAACKREFSSLRATQHALAVLGPARPPADLALRLRVAISREKARSESHLLDRFALEWKNTLGPLAFQLSAGLASAVVLIGGIALLIGMVAIPTSAAADDQPVGSMTQAHLLYSADGAAFITTQHDETLVVEAAINRDGRVYDYRIVSGPDDEKVRSEVESKLLLSVFEPARLLGQPVSGHVVLSFAGVSVHS